MLDPVSDTHGFGLNQVLSGSGLFIAKVVVLEILCCDRISEIAAALTEARIWGGFRLKEFVACFHFIRLRVYGLLFAISKFSFIASFGHRVDGFAMVV